VPRAIVRPELEHDLGTRRRATDASTRLAGLTGVLRGCIARLPSAYGNILERDVGFGRRIEMQQPILRLMVDRVSVVYRQVGIVPQGMACELDGVPGLHGHRCDADGLRDNIPALRLRHYKEARSGILHRKLILAADELYGPLEDRIARVFEPESVLLQVGGKFGGPIWRCDRFSAFIHDGPKFAAARLKSSEPVAVEGCASSTEPV
jgi:hypothetical protein